MRKSITQACVLAAILWSMPVNAALVWNQGSPNLNNFDIVDTRLADDFILAQQTLVTAISFWYEAQNQTDLSSVSYAFYKNASGSLGSVVSTGTIVPVTSGTAIDPTVFF